VQLLWAADCLATELSYPQFERVSNETGHAPSTMNISLEIIMHPWFLTTNEN